MLVRVAYRSVQGPGSVSAMSGEIRTAGSKNCAMDAFFEAAVCKVQCTDDIADCRFFVIFAPVNVWSTRNTCAVEDVRGHSVVKFLVDQLAVLHPNGRFGHILALTSEQVIQ